MGAHGAGPFFSCTTPDQFLPQSSVWWCVSELREGDEVSGGVLDADLPGSVERCAYGHDDFCAVDGGHGFVQVVDFDIKERGALADQFGDRADVFVSAGVAL